MIASLGLGSAAKYLRAQVLWDDGERVFCRTWHEVAHGRAQAHIAVFPASDPPTPDSIGRLDYEYGLREHLDRAWALRPVDLVREHGRTMLVFEDLDGEPLERHLDEPMGAQRFLRLAIAISSVLCRLHERGLIHKDIKPANILVNITSGQVWLTGFGIASLLPRERQSPEPPEFIAGTLAYMAPEQTGRMNRSIDTRSDLYSLGITLYRMLTGNLPFTASDPLEWLHCHIARRPTPPHERVMNIPTQLSMIILKLLAKTPEERYQTAAGVESDLRRCLVDWEARHSIGEFRLGARDHSDRLMIPEKLYGRACELDTLLTAFDDMVVNGRPQLVLVSGHSGVGKSAVVNELQKVLIPPRGLFASGKFDQSKRDVPYATLAQAFQSLIRFLLGRPEPELSDWRAKLCDSLGPNGSLIVQLLPDLKFIIGDQPTVPELPSLEARARFHLVFRRFVSTFARGEHPLALFLDDLQWLDPATLDLIESLLIQQEVSHLLLIGAYRDNEVSSVHPLARKLGAILKGEAKVTHIALAPLGSEDLTQLIVDSMYCTTAQAAPLAQLILEKTAGNPFFVIHFIWRLVDEGLLTFDHASARWRWKVARIKAQGYTDNVVDLVIRKFGRLPTESQWALQQLASLGNAAEIAVLSLICESSEKEVHKHLWDARRTGLVVRSGTAYRFTHDRVYHAAYSSIPEEKRPTTHLRIGRLLVAHNPPESREETVFEIVNQLNRAILLISLRAEKEQLAELNLIAGKRAKASMAYVSALKYLVVGRSLLSGDAWKNTPDLMFALELHTAECEFLTGELAAADARLTMLASRAANPVDRASVACLRIDLYTVVKRSDQAVDVCLVHLHHLGIDCSLHPTEREVQEEYERTWSLLARREIEELIDLPLMDKSEYVTAMDVLTKSLSPARFTDENLFYLLLWRMVNLSLEHGNTDASCHAYVHVGGIAGPRFGNYLAGFRFGRLAYDLVEKRGLTRFAARTHLGFAVLIMSWTEPWRTSRERIRRALDALNSIGDVLQVSYAWYCLIENLLAAGDPLENVQREAERGLGFAQKARVSQSVDIIKTQLAFIRTLRGLTVNFGCFDDAQFDELQFENHLSDHPGLAFGACWYWTRKLQARFFAGDYAAAVGASLNAQRLLWTSASFLESAEAEFYGALSHAASCEAESAIEYRRHMEALTVHHGRLVEWVGNCPGNFENRAALVGAEIARLEGRELDAERLYEEAIKSARENEFAQNEALANELAARFYADRGFQTIAKAYMREAWAGYIRWGADGKVRQLEVLHPYLRGSRSGRVATAMISTPVDHVDFETVAKVSQSVSGEMVLARLVDALMRLAIEHAGAERGVLLLSRGDALTQEAEAITSAHSITVRQHHSPAPIPDSIVQYVQRARDILILDDASTHPTFSMDTYVREYKARSVLCLPLLVEAKLTGVLYLENNLTPRVFTPARIAVLRLLAMQAAISLENSNLYKDLAEREAKIRRLIDANIIGNFIWKMSGPKVDGLATDALVVEANDAFLRMVGYDRSDLAAGRLTRSILSPPGWREREAWTAWEELVTGAVLPFEKEYLHKDGRLVPVLIGYAAFDELRLEGIAFAIDLTESKRAEAEARETDRRYREVQTALEHANRVATMGQIAASIAHEVSQPIFGILTNARTAIRWLSEKTPNNAEAVKALKRIMRDGGRASEVIGRVRTLIRKGPSRRDLVDINGAAREVIELTENEAVKNRIDVRTDLAADLPAVLGDRVQLQQVMMNLIVNAIEAMCSVSEGPRELVVITGLVGLDEVLVAVLDSGPGIAESTFDRLFTDFHTTKPNGMGLGLSISRSIIEAHGGRLWASADVPRGARFQFALPRIKDTG